MKWTDSLAPWNTAEMFHRQILWRATCRNGWVHSPLRNPHHHRSIQQPKGGKRDFWMCVNAFWYVGLHKNKIKGRQNYGNKKKKGEFRHWCVCVVGSSVRTWNRYIQSQRAAWYGSESLAIHEVSSSSSPKRTRWKIPCLSSSRRSLKIGGGEEIKEKLTPHTTYVSTEKWGWTNRVSTIGACECLNAYSNV